MSMKLCNIYTPQPLNPAKPYRLPVKDIIRPLEQFLAMS